MKINQIAILFISIFLLSCNSKKQSDLEQVVVPIFINKGHEIVYNMVQKVGNYNDLSSKKDVVYINTYLTPNGKADISTEKYIFDGELSYGSYKKHERTFSDLEGQIEQGYDGSRYWLKHNGNILTDSTKLKRVAFNRPTNFYWFTMMQKLLDPGLNYKYLGEKSVNDVQYDIVKVSFNSENPTDIYQLYINKKTLLVDQFLFTVADFGAMEIPNLMTLQYEDVDGMMIPSKRKYKKSTWEAEVNEEPWIDVAWSEIKFNNNLTKVDFEQ